MRQTTDNTAPSRWTLDNVERVTVVALYLYFVVNIVSDILANGSLFSVVLLASESAIVVFTLVRRPTDQISPRARDWALGFGATTLPLLVRPGGAQLLPALPILGLMLAGVVLQLSAKLFLRRSFGIVAANRGIKAEGPYRLIRHPMYAGYILTEIGFLLGNATWWNLAIYGLGWGLQIGRIVVEEDLLFQDQAYRHLAEHVRYRLIPRVF